jgi:hypothetical protein
MTIAIVTCFDGIVDDALRIGDDLFQTDGRPSHLGVRLCERKMLLDDAESQIKRMLGSFSLYVTENETNLSDTLFRHVTNIESWTKRCIEVDANNVLLLRMDEWALVCALRPMEVVNAVGESGVVPEEHRNAPAAWVAQRSRSDAEYRVLMGHSKRNADHAANTYICFSGTLEQHYAFDWMKRCFVARIAPLIALRKLKEYASCAHALTAPLVVQGALDSATVLFRFGSEVDLRRVECSTPAEAISTWMEIVKLHSKGAYTRKANISDMEERIKPSEGFSEKNAPKNIGGQSVIVPI